MKKHTKAELMDELYDDNKSGRVKKHTEAEFNVSFDESSNGDEAGKRTSSNYRTRSHISPKIIGSVLLSTSLVFSGSGSTSKKRIYFHPSDVERYNLTPEEIKSLQFYIDEKLILRRVISESSGRHASGRLVTKYGKLYEVIEIKAGTPGVVLNLYTHLPRIDISFEPCCALPFYSWTDVYVIMAGRKEGDTYFQVYDGSEYEMSGNSRLMVNWEDIKRIETKRRVVPGMRLRQKNK